MAAEVPLPEGWTSGEKEITLYEWRCPHGQSCGKNQRLMYKKRVKEDALTCGAWHLFDENKHTLFKTWEEARAAAEEGLTENLVKYAVYYDQDGTERELPRKCDDLSEKNKGGKNKGGGRAKRSRSPKGGQSASSNDGAPNVLLTQPRFAIGAGPSTVSKPFDARAARDHEVVISRVELDEICDNLSRAASATHAAAEWCHQFATHASKTFDDEKRALESCRATLERFRRA